MPSVLSKPATAEQSVRGVPRQSARDAISDVSQSGHYADRSGFFYRYVSQNPDGSWTEQLDKGLTSTAGVVSRFRSAETLEYQRNSLFKVSLSGNFQKRYHDSPGNISGAKRYVSAYETMDAQASYLGLQNFTFTLGGINILNKNPPYANYAASANNFIGGYDVSYGDPRGSFIYGKVVYSFH